MTAAATAAAKLPGADLTIPSRFESILARELQPGPLILPVEGDLSRLDRLRRTARMQGGGLIAFLLGETGCGKTTAAYSAPAHMNDVFAPVILLPHGIPLREVHTWVAERLPQPGDTTIPLLFDGREVTDDSVGLRQLIVGMNALLRTRPDVVVLWPTTDPEWHHELRSVAQRVGGAALVPDESDIEVAGPPRSLWLAALERLLIQLDQKLEDLAVERSTLEELVAQATTVGDFLGRVGRLVVERVREVQLVRLLPAVIFVVTSTRAVAGEANRIRRVSTQLLKADELLGYSRRSRAGLWWAERNRTPEHHLGYMISLFQARLATMPPSSVVYACVEFGDEELREAVRSVGIGRHPGNADRTLRSTDFYRLVAGIPSPELTATPRGRTTTSTERAYANIQGLSATKHKVINQCICQLMERNVPHFKASLGSFEVDQGDRQLYTDAVIPVADGDMHLEFHHIATPSISAMSAYVMNKLQFYALRHNLIPR